MKKFNITGTCVPEENYMVDMSDSVTQIKKLIDNKLYLVIDKPPKIGKTTMLAALERSLIDSGYTVIAVNFGHLDNDCFKWEAIFCVGFIKQAVSALQFAVCNKDYIKRWANYDISDMDSLSKHISKMCRGEKVVLIVDDAGKHSGNHIYLNFLNMLRSKYIARTNINSETFQSVILASACDLKSIAISQNEPVLPMRKHNGLCDVAAEYSGNMFFSIEKIAGMLKEYKEDSAENIDIPSISRQIYDYTSGHPYLVSKLCKCIDEDLEQDWTIDGLCMAVKQLLCEKNALLTDLTQAVENDAYLYNLVYDILITGEYRKYKPHVDFINKSEKIGLIKRSDNDILSDIMPDLNITTNSMRMTNRIYEMLFCNYFISKMDIYPLPNNLNVNGGRKFNIESCLQRFAEYYAEVSEGRNIEYLEHNIRLIFLAYLKEYMSIYGFCYIDSKNTDICKMNIIAKVSGEQYIIELSTQRAGQQSEDEVYRQFVDYLESRDKTKGYLIMFDFRYGADIDERNKLIDIDGKRIFEVSV